MTGWVCLWALAAAIVLVVALHDDPTASRPAEAAPAEPVPTVPAPAAPSPSAQRDKALQKLAKKAKTQALVVKLFQKHRCWKGEAPAGIVPAHALVTLPGQPPAVVAADVGYGIWLDGDPGELHGFCP